MDERDLFGNYFFEPRKVFPSIHDDANNALVQPNVFITIGTIEDYYPDKDIYKVRLVDGSSAKALALVEDVVHGVVHGYKNGDKVYVLIVPGSGSLILKKTYPILDDFEEADLARATEYAFARFLRNGVFLYMREDETSEISLGNAFGVLKITPGAFYASHNALLHLLFSNADISVGKAQRGTTLSNTSDEFSVVLGDSKLLIASPYVVGDSPDQPIVDSSLGNLISVIGHKESSLSIFSEGMRVQTPSKFYIKFQDATVKLEDTTDKISILVDKAGKNVELDISPSASSVSLDVVYNGKHFSLSLLDTPVSGIDLSSNTPVTSFVSINGGTGSDKSSISLSDKVVLGNEQGAQLSAVAYSGSEVSIPIGPTGGGATIVDLKKAMFGVQNMLSLMQLTTPAGPIIPSGSVEFKAVVVDGSSVSLVKL